MKRFALLLTVPMLLLAQDLTQAARELAIKAPVGELTLTVRNLSSLDAAQVAAARRAFETDLRSRGARLAESAPVHLRLTLAESLRDYVLTLEVLGESAREIFLASAPREAARPAAAALALERSLIWEQDAPFLDVAGAGDILYVLEPSRLAAWQNRKLLAQTSLSLPPTRDPRGRLVIGDNAVTARMANGACTAELPLPAVAKCGPGSAAAPPESLESAALDTPCGRYVLITRPTEPTEPDAIQAYDANQKPVGDPLEFPGPITALWPDLAAATAITRNPRTGTHAAYRITVACGT